MWEEEKGFTTEKEGVIKWGVIEEQNSGLFLFLEISSASYIGNTVNIFSSYIF